ncbi:uncharacterized protein [Populus alba]|uniref:Uncharacterized protein n=2 Tax=Populus TaxID=3689 RepID=A0A4U5PY51_POPAL|nr:uncharacterized protein LOC118062957 [Populus alba]KAJ7003517.1 hypothetical protein NC653_008671 [Populus alba x Populus x berolinensis]TKS02568.1 hypothetical protein D5086_0000162720 [Populus alba]
MAASSPVMSNNSSDTGQTSISTAAGGTVSFSAPPKTLRGLNKPKCIQCGNVARSRCPYQSCKSCCSRAQNPCHIHVLKANATFPDKSPASSAPLFEQPVNEAPPAVSSHRAASLRQLSSNFSQFNNLHSPLRSRKPLTRKEAAAINEWRFSKLKEFRDKNIEVENEAFDRYMHNISLLEEVFSLKSFLEGSTEDESLSSNHDHASAKDDTEEKMVSEQKLKLRSNLSRSENDRKRLQQIVDVGLKKLQKVELNNGSVNNQKEVDKKPEKGKSLRAERASALSDLMDKLNKARNEEDLKSCSETKAQLYSHQARSRTEIEDFEVLREQTAKKDVAPQKEMDFFSQKLFRAVEIDHEALTSIDAHFSSLEKIEDL